MANRAGIHSEKSLHSGVGSNETYVRIRHPEYPANVTKETSGGGDTPGGYFGPPEDGVISVDQPCSPAADTSCYALDDFARVLVTDSYSPSGDGGAWGTGDVHQSAQRQDGQTLETGDFTYVDESTAITTMDIDSYVGTYSWPWTERPAWATDCGGLSFTFSGWEGKEAWNEYVVPEHPTDLAGILLGPMTFQETNYWGNTVGENAGATVVVSSVEPGALGTGTVVAHLPGSTATTVFIPASLIPDEGETMYVGIIPAWQADFGEYACGYNWPYNTDTLESAKAGLSAYTDTVVWQSWDVAADAWGGALDSDLTGSWWDGNLPWDVTASGGTYGLDGDNLYLTVSAGGQETLYAKMVGSSLYDPADEDDEVYGEPWTHEFGVNMKARFKITTAGDVTEAGTRFLYFTWNNARDAFKVTVHLGDMVKNEGLTVGDGESSASVDKDITEGVWMWVRMDTRHPNYVRAKMWAEGGIKGSGEPATWDVIATRNDDAENPVSGDFFEIGMSAGNATGADQTIAVDEVLFCGAGDDCEWVTDRLGQSEGDELSFTTAQGYKEGALWFFVDGFHVLTKEVSRTIGTFQSVVNVPPDPDAILVARYLVERDV